MPSYLKSGTCVLCAGADPAMVTPLAGLMPPGHSRFIAVTGSFVVMPTYGCFVPGYLLIVPRRHVLTFGQLDADTLAEAQSLVDELTGRLHAAYGRPVLGFEYGLAAAGVRRIEHAHWHLLPSPAALVGWLDQRLTGRALDSIAGLPGDRSYIAVRSQDAVLRAYEAGRSAGEARQTHRRIRLRRVVAALDPRVDDDAWDWADRRCANLIRATVTDLGTVEAAP